MVKHMAQCASSLRATAVVSVALFGMLMAQAQEGTVWFVQADSTVNPQNGSESAPYTTIGAAIAAAASEDTIKVLPGSYASITVPSAKVLTIESTGGAEATVINANGSGRAATIGSSLSALNLETTLTGFTLKNGNRDASSGSSPAFNTCGGGAFGGTLVDCVIAGNSARFGGGAAYCVLKDCVVSNNTALASGGGAYLDGEDCAASDCTFMDNTAPNGGGAYLTGSVVSSEPSYASMEDCIISGNKATAGNGGGLYLDGASASGCTISDNTATGNGGGVYGAFGANGSITGSRVAYNKAGGSGGGIYGSCADGRDDAMTGCFITHNTAAGNGGGVAGSGSGSNARISLGDCAVSDNAASANGGGVYYGAALARCDIVRNKAANGGGLHSCSTVRCSQIARNTATGDVGGVNGGTLEQCLVYANVAEGNAAATSAAAGAATYNCTIVGNTFTGATTTGVAVRGNNTHRNSIIWGNTRANGGGGNPNHADISTANNMQHCYTTAPTGGTGNIDAANVLYADPKFANAAAGDFKLLSGSPCIDKGLDSFVSGMQSSWGYLDLAGNIRVIDSGVSSSGMTIDIGAYECGSAQRVIYVAQAPKGDDGNDGLSWATAKATIQEAAKVVANRGTIIVSNGTYNAISVANRDITIRSLNGSDVTVIQGTTSPRARAATLGSAAGQNLTKLAGFTLTGGRSPSNSSSIRLANSGGGVYGGTLTDCVIRGNEARFGGGAAASTLVDCAVSNNNATVSGGGITGAGNSSRATARGCLIAHNTTATGSASCYGGGAKFYNLERCTVIYNTARDAGGLDRCTAVSCVIANNRGSTWVGGARHSTLEQCLVANNANTANNNNTGFATYNTNTRNCTITGNRKLNANGVGLRGSGYAVYNGTHRNSIIWNNANGDGNNQNHRSISGSDMQYCYTTSPTGGTGNISATGANATPLFVNQTTPLGSAVIPGDWRLEDLRLQQASPCVNRGNNAAVQAAWNGADLAGGPRIFPAGGQVDIGAYEWFEGVKFYWNDGEDPEMTAFVSPANGRYALPQEPDRAGYTFAGWSTRRDDSGSPVTAQTPFDPRTSSWNVYATWIEDDDIIWDASGGTPALQKTTNLTANYVLPPQQPSRTRYTFDCWKDASGNTVDANTPFTPGQGQFVYAQWLANDALEVILDPSVLSQINPKTIGSVFVYEGDGMPAITPPEAVSTLDFAGYTNSFGVLYYYPDGSSAKDWDKPTGDTLYAAWIDRASPDVVYFGNGGTPVMVISPNGNGYYVPPLTPPTRPDFVCCGWNTARDGSGTWVTDTTPYKNDRCVYAQWQKAIKVPDPRETDAFFILWKNDGSEDPGLLVDDIVQVYPGNMIDHEPSLSGYPFLMFEILPDYPCGDEEGYYDYFFDPSVPAVFVVGKDGKKVAKIDVPSGNVTLLSDDANEAEIFITAIRLYAGPGNREWVDIDVKGCLNHTKAYTVFGHPVQIAKTALENAEIYVLTPGDLRFIPAENIVNEPANKAMGVDNPGGIHTFSFPKPEEDRHFFHVREIPAL